MSGIFTLISNSFGIGSSYKKLLLEIIHSKYQLKAKHEPVELKKILTDTHAKSFFISQLSTSAIVCPQKLAEPQLTNSLILTLKKLSLLHHLTIHYPNFANLIQTIQLDQLLKNIPENDWLLVNVLRPYVWFIKKYCLSVEMYLKLRLMPNGSRDSIFEAMCYAVNLFNSLFATVTKLSSIGRYFREVYSKQVDYFVQLIAYHSQLIYQSFRSCLVEIISFSQQHLSRPQYELMFKKILEEDLASINEEMKKLFLDKYFYPYGKGYGVKLYRIQEQNEYQVRVINGILSDHVETERKKDIKMMEEIVFPKSKLKKGMSCDQLEMSFSLGLEKVRHLKKPSIKSQMNKTMNDIRYQRSRKGLNFNNPQDSQNNKIISMKNNKNQDKTAIMKPEKDSSGQCKNTNHTVGYIDIDNSIKCGQLDQQKQENNNKRDISIEERCLQNSPQNNINKFSFQQEVVEEV